MMMGDYDHLLGVFDHHFGEYVILYSEFLFLLGFISMEFNLRAFIMC